MVQSMAMKILSLREQRGFSLLEVVLAVTLLAMLSAAAVPSLLKFYRQTAIEYETEHLLSDIRSAQSMNRMAASEAHRYGAESVDGQGAALLIDRKSYLLQVGLGNAAIRTRHTYLPMVRITRKGQTADGYISFKDNGGLKSGGVMMTLEIFCEGYADEARRIMISRGGRIRVERGGS